MGISLPNILLILVIVLILFGAGKLPKVMGELGKGLKNFKEGMEGKEPTETKNIESKIDNNSDTKL